MDTFEHDRDRCPVYFGSLPGPEPGVAIIGDYDKVSNGQIVIFNGMLA